MSSFATFPALMPHFFQEWGLSGTEAGWINGSFFGGFTLFGVLATTLTDRIDARRIVIAGCLVGVVGALGFAVWADDFWSALPWRFLSGAGLACTYMPGLRMLTDRLPAGDQSRAIAFYTACFSTGSAVSFLLIGQMQRWFSADIAMMSAIFGPPAALAVILSVTGARPNHQPRAWRQLLNFRPVVGNRQTMGYVIGYFCHTFELMAMRSFLVAFLTFAAFLDNTPSWLDISVIAALIIFLGLPSSVLGNELALKIGRQKAITVIMLLALATSLGVGFTAGLPFWIVIAVSALYGFLVTADSSSLTSGAVASAPADLKGSTMAMHSFVGFSGAMIGPIVAGFVLDASGGHESTVAWGLTYVAMGLVSALGPFAIRLARP